MTNEELSVLVKKLIGEKIRLDARCSALEMALAVVAGQIGIPPQKVWAMIDKSVEELHQKSLEKLEDVDPSVAASLDFRKNPMPDGFD